MASEETPLLTNKHDLIYERFSPRKKKVLIAIVSWSALVSYFTGGTFVPSIPQVAKDLNSTGEIIGYTISINILAGCLGGLLGSKYSKFYGRRAAYLWCLPITIIGSLGVAKARNVIQLTFWRFLQGLGSTPSLSVGAGVIGDIYKLEERGAALGSFFGTGLVGFAIAPTIGGLTAQYLSWRAIHYGLAIFGSGAFFCIFWLFPETSHPGTMGIDEYKKAGNAHPKWRLVVLNPFKQLGYLRGPNMLAASIMGASYLLTDFALVVPFAYTVGKRYGIESEGMIGLCFLPLGVGNAVGAPLAGWISDKIVIKYKNKRGFWYPEDRLRASFYGAFLPFTVLGPALFVEYVPGQKGLALVLICLFLNGICSDIALTPCGAYVVDVLHANSAEATAAVNAFRSIALAVAAGGLLPAVNRFGYLFTNTVVSLITLLGFGVAYLTITYGESMRAWVNVGIVVVLGRFTFWGPDVTSEVTRFLNPKNEL